MEEIQVNKILESLDKVHLWQTEHELADAKRNEALATPDFIIGAVKGAVEIQINGNLRDIKSHLTAQDTVQTEIKSNLNEIRDEQKIVRLELSRLQIDTKPAVEGINILSGIRKFLLWVAMPVGIVYAMIKFLMNYFK